MRSRPRSRADADAELLAAYVDGVTELTGDERQRLEAALGSDPTLRAEHAATRSMVDKLRELPTVGGDPDWTALERSIRDSIGDSPTTTPWWRRWRWVVPGVALAAAVALAVLVLQPRSEPEVVAVPQPAPLPIVHAEDDTVALYVDGMGIEIELDADDLIEDPIARLRADGISDVDVADDLLASDLAWVDDLDAASLARIERLLERSSKAAGSPDRKKT